MKWIICSNGETIDWSFNVDNVVEINRYGREIEIRTNGQWASRTIKYEDEKKATDVYKRLIHDILVSDENLKIEI